MAELNETARDLLKTMAGSDDPAARLQSLRLMQEEIAGGSPPGDYFELAKSLIGDANNDCRWQALIVVGKCIESQPESVWEVVQEYGISPDEDMRSAVATVLLEHLLEHDFDACLPRLRNLVTSSRVMADTLARCSPFGPAEARWDEIRRLLARR